VTVTAGTPSASDPGVEHPFLVPAQLLADPDALPQRRPDTLSSTGRRPHVPRSVRDWVVDVGGILAALAIGAVFVGMALSEAPPPPDALVLADVLTGSLSCLALWWRRRWPVQLAVVLALIGCFSDMASAAVLIALFTVAVHRRLPTVLAVSAVNLAAFVGYTVVRPTDDVPYPIVLGFGVLMTTAVVAWGMFVRARRQLVLSLRERAVRAEDEQHLRVDQARHLERTRIAREMHDVLAHRLSLLSMHAGALEFRPDAPAEEIAAAAGVVRASARQALEDLREVIGVLRDGPDGSASTRPQPTLSDLPALVEECRRAGVRVRAEYRVPDLSSAPLGTGRNAYRVVQEGLTNVRKHAPGTVADVRVEGGPGTGLTIELRNPSPAGGEHAVPLPSAGTGLVGLLERVSLSGGSLEHGWTADGEFRLLATLPWPADGAVA
jgi:signal transduction histidine kinase